MPVTRLERDVDRRRFRFIDVGLHKAHRVHSVGLFPRSMVALAPIAHQITRLELPQCRAFGGGGAAERFCLLTTLNLIDCTGIPAPLLVKVCENNPLLEYVLLSGVVTVDDAVVVALGRSCAALSYLLLDGCVLVADVRPLSNCAKLALLDVAGCTRVPEASRVQLNEALMKLQIRNISY